MREFTTCFCLWCKRLLKRPFFVFTLLLLPLSVLFLQNCKTDSDAIIRVALYTPEQSEDTTASELIKEMCGLSNSAVMFYNCSTENELRQDIADEQAACGYIFPENLDKSLKQYTSDKSPYITAVRLEDDVRTKIVDEIVLSRLYHPISYHILTDFLEKQTGVAADTDWLSETFQKYSSNELLFQFEYASGDANTLLNDSQANYMLMPVRGIVSVIILLACMAGAVLWYSDADSALFLMDKRKHRLCSFLSLFLPGILAAATGLLTIKMTGISEALAAEVPAMLLFLCACLSLVHLLRTIFRKKEFFLASIPVLTIASLLLCPVFISLQTFLPALAPVSNLFPTTWYLTSIHSTGALRSLLLYTICLCAVSFFWQRIRNL